MQWLTSKPIHIHNIAGNLMSMKIVIDMESETEQGTNILHDDASRKEGNEMQKMPYTENAKYPT
jgi:hypothetical protein